MKKIVIFIYLLIPILVLGQAHITSTGYHKPTDPVVIQNLEDWKDLKFGLFMHWGIYSQWGIIESWSLCPEDESWIQRDTLHGKNYFEYLQNYKNLQKTFNPRSFNPEKWVNAAKKAGMKYMVFTTKHHDGFAMYDTKYSDYKITSSKTPYSTNKRADVTKEIFNAFRKENFKIGAYFSKPDWHSDYYWWSYFPPKDRNVNYDPIKHPERWNKFKEFTYNQINEITSDYGKVDILWLDGGWVRPTNTINPNIEWHKTMVKGQDIDMDKIGAMARNNQPGIIIVDRTVAGKWENYVTPEQTIPNDILNNPWESCITIADHWSYVPNDNFKPTKTLIETLIKVVARGGNYLLNIAPSPDGDFAPEAYQRLDEIAKWMEINQSAIYSTRPVSPYQESDYYYTQSKDSRTFNIFHLTKGDKYQKPNEYVFTLPTTSKIKSISILGSNEKVKWSIKEDKITIKAPKFDFNYASVVQIKTL